MKQLLVNVAELRRRVGERRPYAASVLLADAEVGAIRVDPASDLAVEVELESVAGGVSVAGSLRGHWVGECRRCLEPISGDLVVELDEVFEDRPTEGETYPIDQDTLDLGPMVRESAMLALPFGPLCRPDCPGPAPDVFPVTVEDEAAEPPRDPRWAALDQLRSGDSE